MTQTRDTKEAIVLGGKAVTRKGRMILLELHTGSPVALITALEQKDISLSRGLKMRSAYRREYRSNHILSTKTF